MREVIVNSPAMPVITLKTTEHAKRISEIIKVVYPLLRKYKCNPPKINELLGKNARWSASGGGIGVKFIREKDTSLKTDAAIFREIVEASVNRKYMLQDDKKNPARYEETKAIMASLKAAGAYVPKTIMKNQFAGFGYEGSTASGTVIKAISKASVPALVRLEGDLQPLAKAFGFPLKNLHETQSTVKEGHNRNHGSVISVKVQRRTYEQIFYTALHELAHSKEFNHGDGFKIALGDLIKWCYYNRYPSASVAAAMVEMARRDKKYSPVL
jgi:hypothetical protein